MLVSGGDIIKEFNDLIIKYSGYEKPNRLPKEIIESMFQSIGYNGEGWNEILLNYKHDEYILIENLIEVYKLIKPGYIDDIIS